MSLGELEFTCENMDVNSDPVVKLDRLCTDCKGSGREVNCRPEPCPKCEGVGYIQTPAGEAIIRLVLRHQ